MDFEFCFASLKNKQTCALSEKVLYQAKYIGKNHLTITTANCFVQIVAWFFFVSKENLGILWSLNDLFNKKNLIITFPFYFSTSIPHCSRWISCKTSCKAIASVKSHNIQTLPKSVMKNLRFQHLNTPLLQVSEMEKLENRASVSWSPKETTCTRASGQNVWSIEQPTKLAHLFLWTLENQNQKEINLDIVNRWK